MTGLRLVLISLLIYVGTALAQTGVDSIDTPHNNCTIGGMDFNMNSSTRECHVGTTINNCCAVGFHCGSTRTPTPTPCSYVTITPTRTRTPTP